MAFQELYYSGVSLDFSGGAALEETVAFADLPAEELATALPTFTKVPYVEIVSQDKDIPIDVIAITTTNFTVRQGVGGSDTPPVTVGIKITNRDVTTATAVSTVVGNGYYTVSDMLRDIVHRIGKESFQAYGEFFIIRSMNRVYKRLNVEFLPIRKEFTADYTVYTDSTLVDYVALPDDWIKAYESDPVYEFRHPQEWDNDEAKTYTIKPIGVNRRIYVSGATTSLQIDFEYFSSGLKLVNKVVPGASEVNEPEWPDHLKQLVYYETVLELIGELTGYELAVRNRLVYDLQALNLSSALQNTDPHTRRGSQSGWNYANS